MNIAYMITPFLVSLGGVIFDYLTTIFGLGLGLHEICSAYHPIKALFLFWGIIGCFALVLPRERTPRIFLCSIALLSYLGAINNILVISGIFAGLTSFF